MRRGLSGFGNPVAADESGIALARTLRNIEEEPAAVRRLMSCAMSDCCYGNGNCYEGERPFCWRSPKLTSARAREEA
jgi:hypothetical protein